MSNATLAARLTATTEEMAAFASVDMELWNRHSNACLKAASALALRAEKAGQPVSLSYTNWRGETSVRRILPLSIWFGSTEWHKETQWFLEAHDYDKDEERDFALQDFGGFKAGFDAGIKLAAAIALADVPDGAEYGPGSGISEQILALLVPEAKCPRPCNHRPDDFSREACVDAGECGCGGETDSVRLERDAAINALSLAGYGADMSMMAVMQEFGKLKGHCQQLIDMLENYDVEIEGEDNDLIAHIKAVIDPDPTPAPREAE